MPLHPSIIMYKLQNKENKQNNKSKNFPKIPFKNPKKLMIKLFQKDQILKKQ